MKENCKIFKFSSYTLISLDSILAFLHYRLCKSLQEIFRFCHLFKERKLAIYDLKAMQL